ncbi:MAG: hypothetical protein ACRC9Z_10385 [Weissella confusa]
MDPDGYVVREAMLSPEGKVHYVFDNYPGQNGTANIHMPVYFGETVANKLDAVIEESSNYATLLVAIAELSNNLR